MGDEEILKRASGQIYINNNRMKSEHAKSIEREVAYLVILSITLVVLSLSVFPLFLALLPVVIIVGFREIWRINQHKKHPSA